MTSILKTIENLIRSTLSGVREDRRRGILPAAFLAAGLILTGYFALCPGIVFYKKQILTCLVILAAAVVILLIPGTLSGRKGKIALECMLPAAAFVTYLGMADLNDYSYGITPLYALLNTLLIYGLYRLALAVLQHPALSVSLVNLFLYAFAVGNHYLVIFKGSVILPWDLMNAGTGLAVAGGYTYELYGGQLIWLLVLCLISAAFLKVRPQRSLKERIVYSLVSFFTPAVIMAVIMLLPAWSKLGVNLYDTNAVYRGQGIVLSFAKYTSLLFPEEPQGYSTGAVEEITKEYASADAAGQKVRAKNIIVVMNESFCDLSSYSGSQIPEVQEALSFWNSLSENTIRGNLHVSTFGAGTVNSEYEFLTGNSMVYQEGYPFSYKIRSDRPSIARILEQDGFQVQAMHLAEGSNWRRSRVYPKLGIEDFVSIESVAGEHPETIEIEGTDSEKDANLGKRVTDDWDIDKLISLYEQKQSDNYFMFNVTIQNHGGYSSDYGWTDDFITTDLSKYGDYPQDEVFISLLKKSDHAFEKLITYFQQVDEPTLICMFGDHQPKTDSDFAQVLNGGSLSDQDQRAKKYETNFLIWTNYDIEEQVIPDLSTNYLGELVLETAGVELPPYYRLLQQMRQEYPVFSKIHILDAQGGVVSEEEAEESPLVQDYRLLEYNSSDEKEQNICWDAFLNPEGN